MLFQKSVLYLCKIDKVSKEKYWDWLLLWGLVFLCTIKGNVNAGPSTAFSSPVPGDIMNAGPTWLGSKSITVTTIIVYIYPTLPMPFKTVGDNAHNINNTHTHGRKTTTKTAGTTTQTSYSTIILSLVTSFTPKTQNNLITSITSTSVSTVTSLHATRCTKHANVFVTSSANTNRR